MDLNLKANIFLLTAKVGDYYLIGDNKITIIKRTSKRINLSNNNIINIKKLDNGLLYLDSKSITRNHKKYPIINQVLRDIEGFLLFKLLTNEN